MLLSFIYGYLLSPDRKAPRHGPRLDTSARRDPGHGVVTTRKLKMRSESFTGHCLWVVSDSDLTPNHGHSKPDMQVVGRSWKTLPTSFDTWINWIKIWNWSHVLHYYGFAKTTFFFVGNIKTISKPLEKLHGCDSPCYTKPPEGGTTPPTGSRRCIGRGQKGISWFMKGSHVKLCKTNAEYLE